MIPARDLPQAPPHMQLEVALPSTLPVRRPRIGTSQATISTLGGRRITGGVADISAGDRGGWNATLRSLDRPGMVAAAYFAEGVRDVLLRLADGRVAQAHITDTSFLANNERVCYLSGSEPLT